MRLHTPMPDCLRHAGELEIIPVMNVVHLVRPGAAPLSKYAGDAGTTVKISRFSGALYRMFASFTWYQIVALWEVSRRNRCT